MGIILINGMVSMDQRGTGCLGQLFGGGKGAEFALGMDHVGLPSGQFPQSTVQCGGPQPGTGIYQPGIQ